MDCCDRMDAFHDFKMHLVLFLDSGVRSSRTPAPLQIERRSRRRCSADKKSPAVNVFFLIMAIKRLDAASNFESNCVRMKRELKPEEHEEIVNAVAAGDRVKATSIYLSATEGKLTDAQNFVRTLTEEKIAAQQLEKKSS